MIFVCFIEQYLISLVQDNRFLQLSGVQNADRYDSGACLETRRARADSEKGRDIGMRVEQGKGTETGAKELDAKIYFLEYIHVVVDTIQ